MIKIEKYLNKRYGEDFNCYSLVQEVYKDLGIMLPDYNFIYNVAVRHNKIEEEVNKMFIKLSKPEPHCIVLLSLTGVFIDHIGVVLDNGRDFLHALEDGDVRVDSLYDKDWKKIVVGYYKYDKNFNKEEYERFVSYNFFDLDEFSIVN
jgi:cell wall-associated NlpC family hydrolase